MEQPHRLPQRNSRGSGFLLRYPPLGRSHSLWESVVSFGGTSLRSTQLLPVWGRCRPGGVPHPGASAGLPPGPLTTRAAPLCSPRRAGLCCPCSGSSLQPWVPGNHLTSEPTGPFHPVGPVFLNFIIPAGQTSCGWRVLLSEGSGQGGLGAALSGAQLVGTS